jgi:hypothetical protein
MLMKSVSSQERRQKYEVRNLNAQCGVLMFGTLGELVEERVKLLEADEVKFL